jgi:hypothetical protein
MSAGVAVKALVVWFVILVLAAVNGLLREKLLVPSLGAIPGMVLSGVLLSLVVLAVAYLSLPWVGARGAPQFACIGVGWLVLTLIFEFSFGLSRGVEFSETLAAYTFRGGNLWPVVLLVTAVSPILVAKLRGLL